MDTEPEKEACSPDEMERCFKSQMHVGAMPKKICRRLILVKRGEKFVKSKIKEAQRSKRVTAAFNAMRAKAKASVP